MQDNRQDLYEQFVHLEWLLHRYQIMSFRAYGPLADIHRGQGRVLALLKSKPGIGQKELAAILQIRPQSLGELLVKLERSGYITRTTSPEDRRAVTIHLTEAGKLASGPAEPRSYETELFSSLDETERTTMRGYFDKIIDDLENRLEDSPYRFAGYGRHSHANHMDRQRRERPHRGGERRGRDRFHDRDYDD